jgi:hypothetical protein
MSFRFRNEPICKHLIPILPGASTVVGFVGATDIGKLCVASSNNGVLAIGTTADTAQVSGILGIIASVPTATTPASTNPFYVRPITPYDEIEGDYSTAISTSTTLPATTDIGKYIGFSNTTTVAGAVLDLDTIGNARGTTSGCFMKMTGFDNSRRVVFGHINSSHIVN